MQTITPRNVPNHQQWGNLGISIPLHHLFFISFLHLGFPFSSFWVFRNCFVFWFLFPWLFYKFYFFIFFFFTFLIWGSVPDYDLFGCWESKYLCKQMFLFNNTRPFYKWKFSNSKNYKLWKWRMEFEK